jgi:hypothetical protein
MGIPGPNDPDTAYDSGGTGSLGVPCWFRQTATGAPDIVSVSPSWVPFTDGVGEFTDASVDADDATIIRTATAGTYLLSAAVTVEAAEQTEVAPGTLISAYLTLTLDDDAGPLYALRDQFTLPPATAIAQVSSTLSVTAPLPLAVGSVIKATVYPVGPLAIYITGAALTLVRLG